jgi:hypothetical protein
VVVEAGEADGVLATVGAAEAIEGGGAGGDAGGLGGLWAAAGVVVAVWLQREGEAVKTLVAV